MFKVTFATLGVALVLAANTAVAQSGRGSYNDGSDPDHGRPGVHRYDREDRQDRRDIRRDNRDIHRDRRDIYHDRRMLRCYRAMGDWNGMRRAEADIKRDRRDVRRDRRDRYWDRHH